MAEIEPLSYLNRRPPSVPVNSRCGPRGNGSLEYEKSPFLWGI